MVKGSGEAKAAADRTTARPRPAEAGGAVGADGAAEAGAPAGITGPAGRGVSTRRPASAGRVTSAGAGGSAGRAPDTGSGAAHPGDPADHENVVVALLNSRPLIDGEVHDALADPRQAAAWLRARGGTGGPAELRHVLRARDLLDDVVRGRAPATSLAEVLQGSYQVPRMGDDALEWQLVTDDDTRFAVRTVLAWDELRRTAPGRLRACANPDCRLFLLDRGHANRARWCSMAVCGNRMKARRHYARTRTAAPGPESRPR
jgi:predicted RNA-binding Zn ribbon-like protein